MANRFVEAIDDLHVLAAKADRMRHEIRSGQYGDDARYSISERTTDKLLADLDDMACRIRLAVRKIINGEG